MVISNLIRAGFLSLLMSNSVQASTTFFQPSENYSINSGFSQADVIGILTQASAIWGIPVEQLLNEYANLTLFIKQTSRPGYYCVYRSGGEVLIIEWDSF